MNTVSWFKTTAAAVTMAVFVGCAPAQDEANANGADGMNDSSQMVEQTPEQIAAERKAQQIEEVKEEIVNAGGVVYFGFDDAEIQEESISVLNNWAEYLMLTGDKVAIQGHTDERGTREYNMSLGERRANKVIGYLVAQGVDAAQLEAVSYGEESPAQDGSNEYAWSKNRRAVLDI